MHICVCLADMSHDENPQYLAADSEQIYKHLQISYDRR